MFTTIKLLFARWLEELKKIRTITQSSVHWESDFISDEITNPDIYYSIFLVVISLFPALMIATFSNTPLWFRFSQFFGTPLQIIITGFLMSILLFAGAHLNRNPKKFTVAFEIMLRIMSLEPFLRFLFFFRWGAVVELLVFGVLVIIAATKTYTIPLRNALLFFGIVYFVFAALQLQSLLHAPW